MNALTRIMNATHRLFVISGGFVVLFVQTLIELPHFWRAPGRLVRQMMEIGVHTLPLAAMIGVFTGMVIALQTGYGLKDFGLESTVGSIVGLAMVREMGPVITAFLISGRVGSAMAAELGTMAVTDELDALRVMGINPVRFLVVPRFLATLVMQPILTVYSVVIGVWGASVISRTYLRIDPSIYYRRLYETLEMVDVQQGMAKTLVFAVIISIASCRLGLTATGGAVGVGKATTRSVVVALTSILVSDYFVTRFFGID